MNNTPYRDAGIYCYDGTFSGFLCCVFESYAKKEMPADICSTDQAQYTLLPLREIETDEKKSARVLHSIVPKMGNEAFNFIQKVPFTCLPNWEIALLHFFRFGYQHGAGIMRMLTQDDTLNRIRKAVRHLDNEIQLLRGFVRFSDFSQVLVAQIAPKNDVLPFLIPYFCERYPEEQFLIHDKTHRLALVYRPYSYQLAGLNELILPDASEEELAYRALWRLFHQTIEITPRHNPRCQRTHLPLRYRTYMTEFQPDERKKTAGQLPGGEENRRQELIPRKGIPARSE